AQTSGDEAVAQAYFDEALRLNSENSQAQLRRAQRPAFQRIGADLERIRDDLQELYEQPEIWPADFDRLRTQLRQIEDEAREQPELGSQVEQLSERLAQQQQRRIHYDDLFRQASEERRRGNWREAVDLLRQARDELQLPGLAPPAWIAAEVKHWEQTEGDL